MADKRQSSAKLVVDHAESSTRILVVENEQIVAHDLAEMLVELGYLVIDIVATGEAALDGARTLRPDAVLMDVRLAGAMDGIEAAAQIRAEHNIPIIYLTAHADDETLRRAKATEPLGYLVKPFRETELRCAIEIAIHKHEIDARLRVREQWLAATLRSIGEGVVVTDAQLNVTLLNPVAEALTGWAEAEALGCAFGDIMSLVAEQSREPVASPVGRALQQKSGTSLRDNIVLIARGGATTPIADNASPIMNARGEVVGGVMVFRDISDQRRMDEEIQRLNGELERRVAERTEQLEAANRELEAFSYSVAHDLRAPLRGIDGFSQALIEDHAANLGPEGVEQLRRVREATLRMRQLIDDLLQLSRIAAIDLQLRRVDLSCLARTVTETLRRAYPGRVVEVQIQSDLVIDGDERLLQIVLENLIGNSWKFTSKTACARIELGAVDQDATRAYFVRDNGAGFNMKCAHKLFGAFQRFHAASEFEGNGVGLAIVQRIIHRHGGRIWAESAVARGSTFYFVVRQC
jgi:PAS domain S-box-containing protein